MILAVCHESDYASLPPTQIVPILMDEYHWYLASESSFYRVLAERSEHHRRGSRQSGRGGPPRRHEATAPNQVWCWDVSHRVPGVRGVHGCTNGPQVNLECAANSIGGYRHCTPPSVRAVSLSGSDLRYARRVM